MTTIATDGRAMAGDGNTMTANDVIGGSESVKVQRLSDGALLGCAGTTSVKHKLAAWHEAQLAGKDEPFPTIEGPFSALLLMPDGELRYFSEEAKGNWSVLEPPFAIGSGGEIATGALLAGAGPGKAVELASLRCPFTGGRITELSLEGQTDDDHHTQDRPSEAGRPQA